MTGSSDFGERDAVAPPDDMIELAVKTARLSPCAKSKRGVVVFGHDRQSDDGIDAIANGFNGQPAPFRCDGSDRCKDTCAKRCVHAEDRAIRQACAVVLARHRSRSLTLELGDLREYEAVHVKLDAVGNLTWGGGPSCWQCSRTVMDVNLGAFWLYERASSLWKCKYSDSGDHVCAFCKHEACMLHPEVAIARTDLLRWYPRPNQSYDGIGEEHARLHEAAKACECSAEMRHRGRPPVSAVWRRYTAEEFHRATLDACAPHDAKKGTP